MTLLHILKLMVKYYVGLVKLPFIKPKPYERCTFHHAEYLYQIAEWRSREQVPTPPPFITKHYRSLHRELLSKWTYQKDGRHDIWQHTIISEITMAGDCEDFATLLMKQLVLCGYAVDQVGVALTKNHAFAVIIDDEYEVALDNGYLTYYPTPISKLQVAPICGFNWLTEWSYGGV